MKYWYRRGAIAWLLWPASLVFGVRRFAATDSLPAAHPEKRASRHPGHRGRQPHGGRQRQDAARAVDRGVPQGQGMDARRSCRAATARTVRAPRAATVASDAAEVGDEPVLLARRSGCPVWVGPDRLRVIAALRQRAPRCRRASSSTTACSTTALRRDLEIAVVDARGFGNGFLLPAGPLREPARRLSAVDAVVAHGAGVARLRHGARRRDAAPHDRRARPPARCRRSRGRRCTRSPASAIRTASSCTSARMGVKVAAASVPRPSPLHARGPRVRRRRAGR